MFTANFNMSYGESIGSNSSFGSNSFLTAANTVFLGSGSASSPLFLSNSSPLKPQSKFANTLIQVQQNYNNSELDFDLHNLNSTPKRNKSNNSFGALFDDDENLFNQSQEMEEDLDDEIEFEPAIESKKQMPQIKNQILTNRISINKPIEFNTQDNNKNNQNENLSTSHCASITPTSNLLNDSTPQNSVSKFSSSRTFMKLQLMKKQAEEIEMKSGNLSSTLVNNDSLNKLLENDTKTKKEKETNYSLTSLETIPRSDVSDVYQTKLEFPTRYHVQQMTKNLQQNQNCQSDLRTKRSQLASARSRQNSGKSNTITSSSKPSQYQQQLMSLCDLQTNLDHSNNIEIVRNSTSLQMDYVLPSTVSSQYSYDSQSSNLDSTRLTSPSNSSFSQNDFIDELEDIVPDDLNSVLARRSYSTQFTNSQIQDEINQIEEVLNLPKTVPNDGYLKTMTPPLVPSIRPSSSCPADIVRLKKLQGIHFTEEEIRALIKERQKKDNHNMIERRRRFNINDRIKELGTILPKSSLNDKQNKGSILKASVDYIRNLQREVIKSRELEEKLSQMTILNRKLMEKIKSMEDLKSGDTQPQTGQSLLSLLNSPSLTSGQNLENMIKSDNTIVNFEPDLSQKQINQFEQFINQQEQTNFLDNFDSKTMDEMLRFGITNHESLLDQTSLLDENFMDSFN
ncbi:unnamed protein product [Brachionus calyciflorus]|uniref:BHLH domain-containing protein n=1 Tax=Brachionus calyciflorus TaxID=104777 RepID=A0A813NHS8_9BILA|nr:unnamed protein product [Brachionus calyciflorus]